MKATILDTLTGKTGEMNGIDSYQWVDGNWSCDCNRNISDESYEHHSFCLGCYRFLVIAAEFEKDETVYSLAEINDGYSQELIDKYLRRKFKLKISEETKQILTILAEASKMTLEEYVQSVLETVLMETMSIKNDTNDPYPKWKWMMDYCRKRRWHPTDFWHIAEKAWQDKNTAYKTIEELRQTYGHLPRRDVADLFWENANRENRPLSSAENDLLDEMAF